MRLHIITPLYPTSVNTSHEDASPALTSEVTRQPTVPSPNVKADAFHAAPVSDSTCREALQETDAEDTTCPQSFQPARKSTPTGDVTDHSHVRAA